MSITIVLLAFLLLQLILILALLYALFVKKRDFEHIENYTKKKIDKILHTIDTKAASILQIPTQYFHSDTFKAHDKAFYASLEKEYKEGINEMLSARIQDIDKKSLEIVSEFRNTIQLAQEQMLQKLGEERESAEKEIIEYKKQRIEKLESEISEHVQKLSRSILGKGLDVSTHEELIEEALNEIKKQHNL